MDISVCDNTEYEKDLKAAPYQQLMKDLQSKVTPVKLKEMISFCAPSVILGKKRKKSSQKTNSQLPIYFVSGRFSVRVPRFT